MQNHYRDDKLTHKSSNQKFIFLVLHNNHLGGIKRNRAQCICSSFLLQLGRKQQIRYFSDIQSLHKLFKLQLSMINNHFEVT